MGEGRDRPGRGRSQVEERLKKVRRRTRDNKGIRRRSKEEEKSFGEEGDERAFEEVGDGDFGLYDDLLVLALLLLGLLLALLLDFVVLGECKFEEGVLVTNDLLGGREAEGEGERSEALREGLEEMSTGTLELLGHVLEGALEEENSLAGTREADSRVG